MKPLARAEHPARRRAQLLAGVLLPAAMAAAAPQAPPEGAGGAAWGVAPPAWLTEASVSVKQGYDSSIYGVANNLAGHPPIADVSSWFTALGLDLAADLLAGPGARGGPLETLTVAYSAAYTQYAAAAREDNLRSTLAVKAEGEEGPWSFSVDNSLIYVDGSREDAFFNLYDNLGYAVVRERRNQVQERNASFLRYDGRDPPLVPVPANR